MVFLGPVDLVGHGPKQTIAIAFCPHNVQIVRRERVDVPVQFSGGGHKSLATPSFFVRRRRTVVVAIVVFIVVVLVVPVVAVAFGLGPTTVAIGLLAVRPTE